LAKVVIEEPKVDIIEKNKNSYKKGQESS